MYFSFHVLCYNTTCQSYFFFGQAFFCESTFPEYVQYFFLPEDVQLWQPFDTMAFVSLLSFLLLSIIPSRENGRGTKKIFQVNSSQAHFETHEQLIIIPFSVFQPTKGLLVMQHCLDVQGDYFLLRHDTVVDGRLS